MLLLEWALLLELLLLALAGLLWFVARKPDAQQEGERWHRILHAFWKTMLEKRSPFAEWVAAEEVAATAETPPAAGPRRELSVTLPVVVVPESGCDQVVGLEGEAIKMLVSAPAGAGQTNKAVIQLLAEILELHPHQVHLLRGHYHPHKQVRITGLDRGGVEKKLAAFL